jgi:hypothetical protein
MQRPSKKAAAATTPASTDGADGAPAGAMTPAGSDSMVGKPGAGAQNVASTAPSGTGAMGAAELPPGAGVTAGAPGNVPGSVSGPGVAGTAPGANGPSAGGPPAAPVIAAPPAPPGPDLGGLDSEVSVLSHDCLLNKTLTNGQNFGLDFANPVHSDNVFDALDFDSLLEGNAEMPASFDAAQFGGFGGMGVGAEGM